MDLVVETAVTDSPILSETKDLYTLEEVFERIDNKFVDFYGKYGQKIVNDRRTEWNQDGIVKLEML